MIRRLLIANRGEIARRIARTCRRLGIEYVAVHSEADAGAPHLEGASAKVCIGPPPSSESYLGIERLVAAAGETGCDAVHPGYGFLSENAAFARAVVDAGLVFVGPDPDTIAAMGDKSTAKRIMAEAGVPVLPGSTDASDDPEKVEALLRQVGLPALLKPAAGGGGKGMTIVEAPGDMRATVESAIRLATTGFGDGRLLVERFVRRPRHIEVQVFGDGHGNVIHLFERECSLQRRHQKIVEEAPAPNLPDQVRQDLLAAAVQGARAIGYRNAGTFEFLLDDTGAFYFLEVNTRLQVEHPVTEAITGLDLVEWQLRVAAGEALPLTQEDVRAQGHAVECRIYAEDPAEGFRPAPGRVLKVSWPKTLRIESAVEDGSAVPPHYDPMVAKVIASGPDRTNALTAVRLGLGECRLVGLTTNIGFLMALLADERVAAGMVDTRFVDDNLARFVGPDTEPKALACAGALLLLARAGQSGRPSSPWLAGSGLAPLDRAFLDPAAPFGRITVRCGGQARTLRLVTAAPGTVDVAVANDAASPVLRVNGQCGDDGVWSGEVGRSRWCGLLLPDRVELVIDGRRACVEIGHDAVEAGDGGGLVAVAPMPGTVVALHAKAGDTVAKGQVLLVVEAMKMENPVLAPADGTVAELKVDMGASVSANQVLAVVSPPEEQA